MTTPQHSPASPLDQAEQEALRHEAAEADAHKRFDAIRNQLVTAGREDEVAALPELREWLDSRVRTDEAWGRWAMAHNDLQSKNAA